VQVGAVERIREIMHAEGLIDCGLMDQERFSKAMEVLSTLRESQVLIEERYKRILSRCSNREN
jgi:hypothetical protein